MRIGRDIADELAASRAFGGEGQLGFDLGVLRECLGIVERNRRSGRHRLCVCALLEAGKAVGNLVAIVQEKIGAINQGRALG